MLRNETSTSCESGRAISSVSGGASRATNSGVLARGHAGPLGARALYIGSTLYRIHGTTEPWSIGQDVSSGCIRMLNDDVIDLYERQVTRSKAPPDRVRALARAAQVASMRGQPERARGFFELALTGAPADDTLGVLEAAARDGDKFGGGDRLYRLREAGKHERRSEEDLQKFHGRGSDS